MTPIQKELLTTAYMLDIKIKYQAGHQQESFNHISYGENTRDKKTAPSRSENGLAGINKPHCKWSY
jgi:hypothetical protein